jgi:phage virion morphogenesis protein
MAGAGIQIRVNDEEVLSGLAAVDRVADDPSAIMAEIAAFMVTATQRHIEQERGPDGPWPRLSPRTANRRIGNRRRGHDNILRVSGRLYQSITEDSGRDYAAAGTNLVYGPAHQLGATIQMPGREQDIHLSTGRGRRRFVKRRLKRKETRRVTVGAHTITIPPRPYLYLNEADRAEILDIAADGIRRESGGAVE